MAYALVAHTIAQSTDSNTVTTSAIDTTGADIIFLAISQQSGSTATLSDSKGNTLTPLTPQDDTTSVITIFYATNVSGKVGAGHTFSFGPTGGFPAIAVIACSGSLTSADPFDVQNGAHQTTGTSEATGSVTPGQDNEIVITAASTNGTPTFAVNGGFTKSDSIGNTAGHNFALAMGYLIQTTATAANPSWSGWASGASAVAVATFKAAAVSTLFAPGHSRPFPFTPGSPNRR